MSEEQNRRTFVRNAAATALAASSYSRILGANDRVQIGIVGLGGRGRAHLKVWSSTSGAVVTALCDVNQESLERAQASLKSSNNVDAKGYEDMRKLFASKDVDAVSVPLPHHWHALATIWACQAGKDVYVEKPASHNIFEGGKMIEAARKYKRIVQVGSQARSTPHIITAVQLLKEGVIGKIYRSSGFCYKRRRTIGRTPEGPAPPGINWDMFLGPAPVRPFSVNRYRYNWHWFWDTGNGDIGNQGVHEMDINRWAIGRGLPAAVYSFGGKYVYDDEQETPNTQFAVYDYGDCELTFDVRGVFTEAPEVLPRIDAGFGLSAIGNIFYGSEGYMAIGTSRFSVFKGEKHERVMHEAGPEGTTPHFQNFVKALRSRNYKELNMDVQDGVFSADLAHLANISYRLKRRLNFDAARRQFVGDTEANRMLTRNYRPPYVVPDKV